MPLFSSRIERTSAFSLVEVVISIGICSFALIAVIGLFTVGLRISRESEGRIGAVNLAEKILEMRRISPIISTNQMANLAVPVLSRPYGPAYVNGSSSTSYITASGYITNSPGIDTYLATCRAGTNYYTGEKAAQVYLMLSWPAQQNPSNPQAFRYETLTYIPLR